MAASHVVDDTGYRPKRQRYTITNQHYYNSDCFNSVLDMKIQEFGNHFNEINTNLLQNMLAFNMYDLFSKFDASELMRLCEFYPYDFDNSDKIVLASQLGLCIDSVRKDERFANLKGIARVMVETMKHISFHLIYRLLKLTLVLPIATVTIERCFSAMKIMKTNLRNRIGEDFLNICVI
ncbi:uncharacterized protein LOC143613782 [Bidens hawaiensis]|uniref:uncharacterized protein LOC143613782 n=1 Tax=Bidens hawaiensis TaxID=980011 RepID=UPI00404AE3B0